MCLTSLWRIFFSALDSNFFINSEIVRLPSILMTGLVTGLAMLPIALDADNAGREIMGPMAAIIIGGLTSSTILNLFILPAFMLAFGSFVKRS